MTPYAAYIVSESLHLSGVLACVASVIVRRYAMELFSAATRFACHGGVGEHCLCVNGIDLYLHRPGITSGRLVHSQRIQFGRLSLDNSSGVRSDGLRSASLGLSIAWLPRRLFPKLNVKDPMPHRAIY